MKSSQSERCNRLVGSGRRIRQGSCLVGPFGRVTELTMARPETGVTYWVTVFALGVAASALLGMYDIDL